jgi:hypothetical protein
VLVSGLGLGLPLVFPAAYPTAPAETGIDTLAVLPTQRMRVALSPNIAAGGEATTARLTAPSGKSSGDFTPGRRWDDENGIDALTIAADDWTTVAWCIEANSAVVVDAEVYEFRVVADGAAIDAYTVTPQWTIGVPSSSSLPPVQGLFARLPALRRF